MEQLLLYLQTPEVYIPVAAIAAITCVVMLVNKAFKLCAFVFLTGAITAIIGPITSNIMTDNGVTINGSIVSVALENGEVYNLDLSLGTDIQVDEKDNGEYVVTVVVDEGTPTVFTVPAETAKWIEICANALENISDAGANVVVKATEG